MIIITIKKLMMCYNVNVSQKSVKSQSKMKSFSRIACAKQRQQFFTVVEMLLGGDLFLKYSEEA